MKRGFTIAELLVVIVVLGVLATLSVVVMNGYRKSAADASAEAMAAVLVSALNNYYVKNNEYPLASELHGGTFNGLPPSNYNAAATKLGITQSNFKSSSGVFFMPCWTNMGTTAPGAGCSYGYYGNMSGTNEVKYITKDIANNVDERSYIVQSPNGPNTTVEYCEIRFASYVPSRSAFLLTYFSNEENKVKYVKGSYGETEMYSPMSGQCVFTAP